MFQPQATPYLSYYPYGGLASPIGEFGVPNLFSANFHGNNNHHTHPFSHIKMEGHDMEAQEALAREFQPELQGPLVGEKRSSHAITEEYAKADPVYVTKTAALPQKFSHYRPVLGDGNCGWRAVGYSYLETLVRLRNKAQFEEEIARIISLNNFLTTTGGYDDWMIEEFTEATITLMRELAETTETSPLETEELLRIRFNDADSSNHIIYHLRMLAISWLKDNIASYSPWIPDEMSVERYCETSLQGVNQEIDHLGMTLLIAVLLKPVGFAVEIVYLDRSEGSQANSHFYPVEDINGIPGPTIYLLYRPSHYDILYKDVSVHSLPTIPQNTVIQVNRATNFQESHIPQNTPASMGNFGQVDMSLLACIPGFQLSQLPPQPSHHSYPPQFQQPLENSYAHSPMSSSISSMSPGTSSTPTSTSTNSASYPVQPHSSSLISPILASPHASFPPATVGTTQLPSPRRPSFSSRTSYSGHPSLSSDFSSPTSTFRPSKYEWEAAVQEGPVILQTSTFRNSHFNPAHYSNANFQPEEWAPESEHAPSGRKRST